jgi:hypothetical protein
MSFRSRIENVGFDAEATRSMEAAFATVRGLLGIADDDQTLPKYAGDTIVEIARRGVRDPRELADAVLQALEDEAVIGCSGERFVDPAPAPQLAG